MNPYIRTLVEGIARRPVLIRPAFLTEGLTVNGKEVTSWGNFAADLQALARVNVLDEQEIAQLRRDELCKAYGFNGSDPGKTFAFAQGNAIIPVHGTLMNRLPYSFGFATGYNFITSQLGAAMADPEVSRIIYDVNSNGGTVAGCPECAQAMYDASAANGGKQSVALVDTNCYSAAYYLASAADHIAITPSGGAGSIGVVMAHMDVSKLLDELGVKVTFIHAGDHKVDGNMFEPLSEEVTSDFQAEVDKIYGRFVADVSTFRPNLTDKAVRDTQAKTYQAEDALALGLVDSVQTPSDALRSLDAKTQAGEITMSVTQADVDQAAANARTAERSRVQGIIGHPEAEGRGKLANHLAMNTDMTVEAAAGILQNSPKEAAPAAPAATEAKQPVAQETNHFKNAMDKGGHPNVGTGNGTGNGAGEGGTMTRAQQILAAQTKVTGRVITPDGKAA